MKKLNLSSLLKMTFVALLLTIFGFQQAQAQLTVINNTNCWIAVGEFEGPNCQQCNNPQGTWIAPNGGIAVFQPTCPSGGGPVVSPFPPPPPGFQSWIGVKYGATLFPPNVGQGSFSNNPNYLPGPCFGPGGPAIACGGGVIQAVWGAQLPNGSTSVTFQY